jgi:hypothetical protein
MIYFKLLYLGRINYGCFNNLCMFCCMTAMYLYQLPLPVQIYNSKDEDTEFI